MDIGLVTGIVVSLACLVLVWPAVRRAGSGAVPMLLFWAAAIAAVTFLVLLAQRWQAPSAPHAPPPVQRGVAV
jgi:uncharacterized protein with PQ loop repeat